MVHVASLYAPVETTVFRDILESRCGKRDKNGQAPLVIDVGGNIGYFSTYAASFGCRVAVFEPLPRAIRYINMSIFLNGFSDRTTINHVAASDTSGVANLHEDCRNTGFTRLDDAGSIAVRTARLDDIIDEEVLLLKIDTEGHEMKVLEGAARLFEEGKVRNVIVEMKPNDAERKVAWINARIAEGMRAWSFCENYENRRTQWNVDIRKPIKPSEFTRLENLTPEGWLMCEDVVISRDISLRD